ncbi:hypothetical protein SK128_015730 [Halocaridina rubra]|uniref:Clip domain-containing protein n=1 Tax=Halocaridina rubra TaxID=373956 RepID=A0AAN8ZYR8_HALRR
MIIFTTKSNRKERTEERDSNLYKTYPVHSVWSLSQNLPQEGVTKISKMLWCEALLVFLPLTSAQIIFPGEMVTSSIAISEATSVLPVTVNTISMLPSSLLSASETSTVMTTSEHTALFSISPVPSTNFSLTSVTLTVPGSVTKASTIPVLRPSPVALEAEVTATTQQTILKSPSFQSLHPKVPSIKPVTPTPISIPLMEFTGFTGSFNPFDYDYDYDLPFDPFFQPSSPSLPTSFFETAPLNPPASGFHMNASSTTNSLFETEDSSTASPFLEFENIGHSASTAQPEVPGKTANGLIPGSNVAASDSITTNFPPTETIPPINIQNPEEYDEILVSAIITMGENDGADIKKNKTCTTPLGENGTCIALKYCVGYFPLAADIGSPVVINFLRTRVCKLLPRAILFCCPDEQPILPFGY